MSCQRRVFMMAVGATAVGLSASGCNKLVAEAQAGDVRYGMIHDETACIGCQACEEACREVNHVPEGYARLRIIPTGPLGIYPNQEYHFYRQSCEQCENPPCVSVCPTGACYYDAETGIIDIHSNLCVGCKYCVFACPYKVRYIHPITRLIDKCDFCKHTNLAAGKQPACVEICPTQALTFGDLNDPNSAVSQKLAKSTTYRAKESLGTRPKLNRIPKGRIRG